MTINEKLNKVDEVNDYIKEYVVKNAKFTGNIQINFKDGAVVNINRHESLLLGSLTE